MHACMWRKGVREGVREGEGGREHAHAQTDKIEVMAIERRNKKIRR